MNIYLLRHGQAVERGAHGYERDADRPLTPEGEKKLKKGVSGMKALGLQFDLVLASPLVRARRTAEIVARGFQLEKQLKLADALGPDGSGRQVVELLRQCQPQPKSVLLVGHEPDLSHLISLLTAGDSSLDISLKKGGLCQLTVQNLRAGRCASLDWLLTAKQLALCR